MLSVGISLQCLLNLYFTSREYFHLKVSLNQFQSQINIPAGNSNNSLSHNVLVEEIALNNITAQICYTSMD
jgi:hypothetical protein